MFLSLSAPGVSKGSLRMVCGFRSGNLAGDRLIEFGALSSGRVAREDGTTADGCELPSMVLKASRRSRSRSCSGVGRLMVEIPRSELAPAVAEGVLRTGAFLSNVEEDAVPSGRAGSAVRRVPDSRRCTGRSSLPRPSCDNERAVPRAPVSPTTPPGTFSCSRLSETARRASMVRRSGR